MAAVKNADIPTDTKFMRDFWILVQKFWIPEDNALYWESLSDAIMWIEKRYQTDFCRKMLLAYTKYLIDKPCKDQGGR